MHRSNESWTPRQWARALAEAQGRGRGPAEQWAASTEQLPTVAAEEGYVRVVDESGEDDLYPESYFVAVELPREAKQALARRSS